MMKIIIASDSHGRNSILDLIPYYYQDASYFLFCGDLEDDPIYYEPWECVEGNNDWLWYCEEKLEIELENHKILVIHGDQFFSHTRKQDLAFYAKQNDCDIVCYGHTHVPSIDEVEGILLINPGSLQHNRDGSECSYAILTIEENIEVQLVYESDWPF